jgi:hypothetical protein
MANNVRENWGKNDIVSVDFPSTIKTNFKAGQIYHCEVARV